ncbi:MAG: S8 family serine peptidase [Defluviitaleaceae bacterium]|nr:S8 family serine peptidase [Defluviitaleaceae bacterium]
MSGWKTNSSGLRRRSRVLRVITAFLLVMLLAVGPVMPVFATAMPEVLERDRLVVSDFTGEIGQEYLEPFEALALHGVFGEEDGILLSTLGVPLGAVGFEGAYALNNPNEMVEIVVTFRTPPSVALRLIDEAADAHGLSPRMARMSYEAQALTGHANFAEQLGSLPVPFGARSGFQIFGEHHTLFNGVYMRVPAGMVEAIASLPEVFAVTPNITFYAIGMLNDELYQHATGGEYCDYEDDLDNEEYGYPNEEDEDSEEDYPYNEDEKDGEEDYPYNEEEKDGEEDYPYNEDEDDEDKPLCEYGEYCECEEYELPDYLNYLVYSIAVTPGEATMELGESLRFEAAAYNALGYFIDDADIVWGKVDSMGEELAIPNVYLVNGWLVLGPDAELPENELFIVAACAQNPEVYGKAVVTVADAVEPAYLGFMPLSSIGDEFNLAAFELMDIAAVHAMGHTGSGVHVSVLDTGIDYYYHPRFIPFQQSPGNFLGADFIGDRSPGHRFYGSPQETGPWDTDNTGVHTNHGSHVAGTVIAMAPDITLSHVRVLGPGGSSVGNSVMLGIEWAYNNGADVMNLSLSARHNVPWMPNAYALDMATLAGIFISVAAGNDGAGGASPIFNRGGWFSIGVPSTSSLSMTVGNAMAGGLQFEDHPNATINGIEAVVRLHGRSPLVPNNVMNMRNNVSFAFFGQIELPATLDAANNPFPPGIIAVEDIANDLISQWGNDLSGYTVIANRGLSNFASMMYFAYFLNADALIIRNNLAQGDVFLVHPGFSAIGVTGVDPDILLPVYSIRNSVADPIFGPFTNQVPIDQPEIGTMNWENFARTHLEDILNAGSAVGPISQTFHLKPDIVAPGTQVLSAMPVFMTGNPFDNNTWDETNAYSTASGTSMSAPAIAGIVAAMMNAFPNASVAEIKARLMQTSRDLTGYTGTYSVLQVGGGFVMPYEAITSTAFAIVEHEVPWLIDGVWDGDGNIINSTEGWAVHDMASLSFGRVEVDEDLGGESEILTIAIDGGSGWTFSYAFVNPSQALPTPPGHPGWGRLRFPATGITLDIQNVGGNVFTAQISHNGTGDAGFAQGYVTFTNGSQTLRVPFGVYMDIFVEPEPITARPGIGIWRPVISNFLTPPGGIPEGVTDPRSDGTALFGANFYLAAPSNISAVSIGFDDVRGHTRNVYWYVGPYGSEFGDGDVVHFSTTTNLAANATFFVGNLLRPFLSPALTITGQPSLLGTFDGEVLPAGVYSLFPVLGHRPGDYLDTDTVLPPMHFVVVDERPLIHFDSQVFAHAPGAENVTITGRVESFGHDMAILHDIYGAIGTNGLPTINEAGVFDYAAAWLMVAGGPAGPANPDGSFSFTMPLPAGTYAGPVPVHMQVVDGDGIGVVAGSLIPVGAHASLVAQTYVVHEDYVDIRTVTVSPNSVYVIQGENRWFSSVVSGPNNPLQSPLQRVTWSVTGHAGASISAAGLLTVRNNVPIGAVLTVRATSVFDTSVFGTATVRVVEQISVPAPPPSGATGVGTPTPTPEPEATPVPIPRPELIPIEVSTPAIENGLDAAAPVIEFILDQAGNDHIYLGVELDADALEELIEQDGSIVVRGSLFNMYISNEELAAWDTEGVSVITILLHLEDADMSEELADQILAHDDFNSFFLDNLHLFTVLADDDNIAANATITANLPALGLTVAQQIMMAAYAFDYDGQAYALIPSTVSEDGILSFEFSGYGVIGAKVHVMPSTFMRLNINSHGYSLNGEALTSDVVPFITQNRTMVPLRIIAEALGGVPRWDSANRTAYIYLGDTTLRLPIGEALPDNMGAPELRNDRVFVPMRYVSEMLGARVRWDGPNQAVYVYRR